MEAAEEMAIALKSGGAGAEGFESLGLEGERLHLMEGDGDSLLRREGRMAVLRLLEAVKDDIVEFKVTDWIRERNGVRKKGF